MRRIALLPVLSLAACSPSAQEIRSEPARFELHVPGNVMDVGSCLAAIYSNEEGLDVSYFPRSTARQTEVLVSNPPMLLAPKQPMFTFELTEEAGGGTRVTLKRRTFADGYERIERQARERVERCGRA